MENGDDAIISVADTGSGIPDELKTKVMDRHRKGATSRSGSGLGLFIVNKLVERYGGTIGVTDRIPGHPEEGARFIITLRRA